MLGLTHILLAALTVLAATTAMALAESASATATTTMASRHDYKLTLKRPFLYSDNKTIPFYERFGEEYVLLTPSAPRLKGAVWSKKTNPHKEWMVHLSLHIHGNGRFGGDGMAFWYTEKKGVDAASLGTELREAPADPTGQRLGPAFGSADTWRGFGLIFDTFAESGNRNSPYVYGLMNDGSWAYSQQKVPMNKQVGGCYSFYRNIQTHTNVRITHADSALTVDIDVSGTGTYVPCFTVRDVALPTGYYFGASASTGTVADSHDLVALEVYEVGESAQAKRQAAAAAFSKTSASHVDEDELRRLEELEKKFEQADIEREKHEFEHTSGGASSGADDVSPHDIEQIRETQFKVLEHLEMMAKTLDELRSEAKRGAATTTSSSDNYSQQQQQQRQQQDTAPDSTDKLRGDVQQLIRRVDAMYEVVEDLAKYLVHKDSAQGEDDRRNLENVLASMNTQMKGLHQTATTIGAQSTLAQQSTYGPFTYMLLFLSCQFLAVIAYGKWKEHRGGDRSKKFI